MGGFNYVVSSPKLTTEKNKAGSLEFSIPPINPMYNKLKKMRGFITVKENTKEIWRGRILDIRRDFYNIKEIFCEGELSFLNDVMVPAFNFGDNTIDSIFNYVISYYAIYCDPERRILPGVIEGVEPDSESQITLYDYASALSIVSGLIDESSKNFIKIRHTLGNTYLDYTYAKNVSEQTINFGKNLIDLDEYISAANVFTHLIPFGKTDDLGNRLDIRSVNGGDNYIYSKTASEKFGSIWSVATWENVEDPSQLMELASKLLLENIEESTSINIKAVDLHLLGVNTDEFEVGKLVRVVSIPHGINSDFLCSKIVLDLENPELSEYTFGSIIESLTDKQAKKSK